ncbi:MAG: hypothetical protein ACLQVM_26600 [Terriglobia bacterium]
MSRILQRLNVLAICVLGGVLGAVLAVQVWPRARALAQVRPTAQDVREEAELRWPETLTLCPAHAGDPVKLVKVTKAGLQLQPGKYELPKIAGDDIENPHAVHQWLGDVAFTLRSEASKSIVSVGIAVMLPVRRTDLDCLTLAQYGEHWCDAHPHYCDGGCPGIRCCTLHWGLVPHATASGLRSRYAAWVEAHRSRDDRPLLQGTKALLLPPGGELTLSADGRGDSMVGGTDQRGRKYPGPLNWILSQEGIEEAKGARTCDERNNPKTGCAFAEVPKFNIGVDVVYFEDGTIWGNYGYGYATPNPNGIFTRVSAEGCPLTGGAASGPN